MPTDAPSASEDVHVPTGADYVSDRRFADFPVSPEVLKGIADLGYIYATPVQAVTIEPILAGRDMLVRAKTGTGKTAAFCVPLIEKIEDGARRPKALVLAPTRELAQQIGDECQAIAKYRDISLAVLVGGLAMGPQEDQLGRGVEIVIGTPGRILDHQRRKNLDLSQVEAVVLDEADEMLSMGFYEDVTSILDMTAKDRQVLLFSATISEETRRLADTYLREPEDVMLSTDADNVGLIDHVLYETTAEMHKIRALLYLLDIEDPVSAIIFCNTREDTATVASFLDRQGLDVQLLSGELSQARRSQVMGKVKAGEVRFLVSTDVAARGIDISDLSHVINYSLPQDPSVYLHRTGRTGRIGKSGTAISLVGGTDLQTRRVLETKHGIDFTVKLLPDSEIAVGYRIERQARIRAAMGSLVFEAYLPTVRALKERPDGEALLAAALRAFFQWDRQRRAAMSEVDSISDLIQQRNDKIERRSQKGRSGGRGERDRDRGPPSDRRRRDDRSEGPRPGAGRAPVSAGAGRTPISAGAGRRKPPGRQAAVEDLDALLVSNGDEPEPRIAADLEGALTVGDGPGASAVAGSVADDAERKRKKRRRRRKKGEPGEPGSTATEAEPGDDSDDDLDALLTSD